LVAEILPFEVLPRMLFQEGRSVGRRSVVNITLISYTSLCYVRNVAKRSKKNLLVTICTSG